MGKLDLDGVSIDFVYYGDGYGIPVDNTAKPESGDGHGHGSMAYRSHSGDGMGIGHGVIEGDGSGGRELRDHAHYDFTDL